jgi:hypothetical protein
VVLRFKFDTVDDDFNTFEGWYVDDIALNGVWVYPVNGSGLAVRIQEGAGIQFSAGGVVPIISGDMIQGGTASAKVLERPILSSGSWAGSDAAGTLILTDVAGTFAVGETVVAFGSGAQATVNAVRSHDNYIRVYHSNRNGRGTPDGDILDEQRQPYPRGTVDWPPDDPTAGSPATDYFTLTQWDGLNSAVGTISIVNSAAEPNAIIRSSENDLLTPTSLYQVFTQPELGLHAFGDGAANVFFDDFAVQATGSTGTGSAGFGRVVQR